MRTVMLLGMLAGCTSVPSTEVLGTPETDDSDVVVVPTGGTGDTEDTAPLESDPPAPPRKGPPSIRILRPQTGDEVVVGQPVSVEAEVVDPDDLLSTLRLVLRVGPSAVPDGLTPTGPDRVAGTWVPEEPGSVALVVSATDTGGLLGRDDLQLVVVPGEQLPVCALVEAEDGMPVGLTVPRTLTAAVSDPNDPPTLVEVWWTVDGSDAVRSGTAADALELVVDTEALGLDAGEHVVTVHGRDLSGNTCEAAVTVEVTPPPRFQWSDGPGLLAHVASDADGPGLRVVSFGAPPATWTFEGVSAVSEPAPSGFHPWPFSELPVAQALLRVEVEDEAGQVERIYRSLDVRPTPKVPVVGFSPPVPTRADGSVATVELVDATDGTSVVCRWLDPGGNAMAGCTLDGLEVYRGQTWRFEAAGVLLGFEGPRFERSFVVDNSAPQVDFAALSHVIGADPPIAQIRYTIRDVDFDPLDVEIAWYVNDQLRVTNDLPVLEGLTSQDGVQARIRALDNFGGASPWYQTGRYVVP